MALHTTDTTAVPDRTKRHCGGVDTTLPVAVNADAHVDADADADADAGADAHANASTSGRTTCSGTSCDRCRGSGGRRSGDGTANRCGGHTSRQQQLVHGPKQAAHRSLTRAGIHHIRRNHSAVPPLDSHAAGVGVVQKVPIQQPTRHTLHTRVDTVPGDVADSDTEPEDIDERERYENKI